MIPRTPPLAQRPTTRLSWRDYGQVIPVEDLEEAAEEAGRVSAEHEDILTAEPRDFLERLTNHGALFLGPETNVACGDKGIGANHTLLTRQVARHTAGLWAGEFIKTVTYGSP